MPTPSAVYYVRATSIPNRFYAVGEFPGTRQPFRCECKAGEHGRRCWHVDVVIAGAVKPAALKPAPRPVMTAERKAVLDSLYA